MAAEVYLALCLKSTFPSWPHICDSLYFRRDCGFRLFNLSIVAAMFREQLLAVGRELEQSPLPLLPIFWRRIQFAGQNDQRYIAKGLYRMMRLGIGHDLTRIALNPKYPRKLASEAELRALRPELQHIE